MLGQNSAMNQYALREKRLMSGPGGHSVMNDYARNDSVMDQYATMEHRLMELGSNNMNGYYSINLGEDVVSAANDPFWQQYGLPSIELGGVEDKSIISEKTARILQLILASSGGFYLGLYFSKWADK